jgi:serine/threonine-protein kinase
VKVLDFGISKIPEQLGGRGITATADVFGTPAYMSPEQTRSAKLVDARADIWSLGLILAECISGKPVYEGSTQLGVLTAVGQDPLPSLRLEGTGTEPELERIIRRCLEKDPAHRYQDVTELARDLAPFAGARPISTSKRLERMFEAGSQHDAATTAPEPANERATRTAHRLPKGAAWFLTTGLVAGLGVTLLSRRGRTDISNTSKSSAVTEVRPVVSVPAARAPDPAQDLTPVQPMLASSPGAKNSMSKVAALGAKPAPRPIEGPRSTRSSSPPLSDGLHDRK